MTASASRKRRIARLAAIATARRSSGLSDVEYDILVDLAMNPEATQKEIAARLARNEKTLRRDLSNLRNKQLIGSVSTCVRVWVVRYSITPKGERILQPIALAAA